MYDVYDVGVLNFFVCAICELFWAIMGYLCAFISSLLYLPFPRYAYIGTLDVSLFSLYF